jgi:uncharacterized surface protein with fasciclin (FAS1) repeats
MSTRRNRARIAALGAVAALSLMTAACGDDDAATADTEAPAATDAPAATEPMTTEPMTPAPAMLEPSGPACSSVPTEGEGSFAGMADDPAATAASNNPELSTLVAAVGAAGLVDTLNGEGPFTIFAPANSAFAALPAGTVDTLLADPTGDLTDILTIHVVGGEALTGEQLVEAGTVAGLNGDLTVAANGDAVTVDAGGGPATVVCANVPVANGVVHIIDTVLLPAT